MKRLASNVPAWVAGYIDVQFKANGRGASVDCWGLVRRVFSEQWGIVLPSHEVAYRGVTDSVGASAVAVQEAESWRELPQGPERVGDVGLFRVEGVPMHVGMAVSKTRMLHTLRGVNAVAERFDSELWRPRLVSWYRYNGPVNVLHKPSPLRSDRVDLVLPAGATIAEHLVAAGVANVDGLHAVLNGVEVAREAWERVRPKPGSTLAFAVTAQGGGNGNKTVLRVVLTIALVALAVYTGGATAGSLGYTAGSTGFAVVSGVVAAGVTIAGTLLINALVPLAGQRLSDNGGAKGSTSIAGARNQARPFAPVNVVLGKHRVSPPYAAQPYTEIVGDDQYLRILFDVGYGPLALSEPKIGETPLSEFDGVEVEMREGELTDEPLTLFPGQVLEEAVASELTEVGGWVQRTSATDADELGVDVTFPSGLAKYNNDGSRSSQLVQWDIEYRPVGTVDWQTVNDMAPVNERQMDLLFRTPEIVIGGSGVHVGAVQWSADGAIGGTKPVYLPAGEFSWEVEGYLKFDRPGTYEFAVDGSDAIELKIGGRVVVGWYGNHGTQGSGGSPSFDAHRGTIYLGGGGLRTSIKVGWVRFRLRVAGRSGGAAAVAWKVPGASVWSVIPGDRFRTHAAAELGVAGLAYRWCDTSGYRGAQSVSESRGEPLRRNVTWAVPRGQYDVRVRRVTADAASDRIVDRVYWSALRSTRNSAPVRKPGRAMVALRIKATDQLNGVVDTFNLIAQSILPAWDGVAEEWVAKATSNPASIFRGVLQGPATAKPVADERIDLAELQDWAEVCDAKGFEFNAVLDFGGTVYERLRDVCAAGRASVTVRDAKYSVVRDRIQTVPVQTFTPRNSRGLRGSLAYPDPPHGLKIRFLDADQGYQQNELAVFSDGYSLRGDVPGTEAAESYESIELFGVTKWAQVWSHGRYYLAVAKLRPEVFELEVDVEHLICQRGDLVLVTHDVPLLGIGSGRISAVRVDGSGALAVVALDNAVSMDAAFPYALRVRKSDGSILTLNVVRQSADGITSLTLDPPLAVGVPWPEVDDMFLFGQQGKECRECIVRSIVPGRDLSARLQLVDHAPSVHAADVGLIPAYDSGITRPPTYAEGPAAPEVLTIQSDDLVMTRDADGSLRARMVVTIRVPSNSREAARYVEVRTRAMPADADPTGPFVYHPHVPIQNSQFAIEGVEEGVRYQIRVRSVAQSGRASAWVSWWTPTAPDPDADGAQHPLEHTVVGKLRPPPDVVAFDVAQLGDGTRRYTWDLGTVPPDIAGVVIRYGPGGLSSAWEDLVPLHDGVLEGASPTELNAPAAGTWTFGIKMRDTTGNESVRALLIDRTLGGARQEGVIVSSDAFAEQWPGSKTECYRSNDGALTAVGRVTWAELTTWAAWETWTQSPASPIIYEHPTIDAGFIFDAEPAVVVAGVGVMTVEVSSSVDNVTFTAWQDVAALAGRTVRARYWKFRLTVATAFPDVARVTSFLMMLRARAVEQLINDLDTSTLASNLREGPGDFRVPISSGMFAVVRSIALSFNGAGAGWTWEVVDRLASPGPRVRIYNQAGELADATIDAVVRGLEVAAQT